MTGTMAELATGQDAATKTPPAPAPAAAADAVVDAGDEVCSREFISANLLKRLRLRLTSSTITVGFMSVICSLMQLCSIFTKKKNESSVNADITEPELFFFLGADVVGADFGA